MTFFSLKHKKPLTDHLGFIKDNKPLYHYVLAFIVGLLSAFATIGFIKLYELITRFIYFSPSANFLEVAQTTPGWYFYVVFGLGGLLVGLFIYYFIPYHGHGHGFPNLLYCYRHFRPIEYSEGLGTTLTNSLSLGLGASVGREMPAIFLSSSLTTWLCKVLKVHAHTLRVMIAAAVGTSLATSLHSSFVGFFFIMEVISYSLTALDLLPITLAIFTGVFIREFFTHILPPFSINLLIPNSGIHVPSFVLLGLFCGLMALVFTATLTQTIKITNQSSLPKWLWPFIGGLGLATAAQFIPESLGLGFTEMGLMLEGALPLWPVLILSCAKFITILISLGFGFSGGIFTPAIFWGLTLGSIFASVMVLIFPHSSISFGMYALMASAAFTSVVIGAPITMTFFAYELTSSLEICVNTFIVVFCAQLVMKSFGFKSFFQSQYTYLYDR